MVGAVYFIFYTVSDREVDLCPALFSIFVIEAFVLLFWFAAVGLGLYCHARGDDSLPPPQGLSSYLVELLYTLV